MLDEILAAKRIELAEKVAALPFDAILRRIPGQSPPSLAKSLDGPQVNVIAEIKYRSPSRGDFPCTLPPDRVARQYADNGAAAISVLTDQRFFNGDLANLEAVRRELPDMPLLRKDFILDRYQVVEARVGGASACLLIAAALETAELASLVSLAADYRMEALVEIHDAHELEEAISSGARMIGVNNRNLRTFEVDLRISFDLARRMEGETGYRLVTESGLKDPSAILELRDAGYCGFLIGSALMESDSPGEKLGELLAACRQKT